MTNSPLRNGAWLATLLSLPALCSASGGGIFTPLEVHYGVDSRATRGSASLQLNAFRYEPHASAYYLYKTGSDVLVTADFQIGKDNNFSFGGWYAGGTNCLRSRVTGNVTQVDSKYFEIHGSYGRSLGTETDQAGINVGYLQGELNESGARETGRWLIPTATYSHAFNPSSSHPVAIGLSLGYGFSLDRGQTGDAWSYSVSGSVGMSRTLSLVASYYVLDVQGKTHITRLSAGVQYRF